MSAPRRLAIAAAALALGGCSSPFNTLSPAGEQAQWLATMGWWLIGLMSLIIVVMGLLVLWPVLQRRGSLHEHAPVDIDGGKRWIIIGGVLVPVVFLSALFFVTLGTLRAFPGEHREPAVTVKVTGHQWWWGIEYVYPQPSDRFTTANELHVPVGEPVEIRLQSADVIHSFWVPRLHGKLDVIPGQENRLVLEAREPGVYRGQCAEYCGVQHANMKFTVVAQPRSDYERWVANQRRPARTPTDPLLAQGRNVFEQYACAMCHRIRGTLAHGGVAPDLTHFGGRRRIAGVVPNTRARLQAWIVDAQAMKPGVHMPTLEQMSGEQLNAVAAYLESLE